MVRGDEVASEKVQVSLLTAKKQNDETKKNGDSDEGIINEQQNETSMLGMAAMFSEYLLTFSNMQFFSWVIFYKGCHSQ